MELLSQQAERCDEVGVHPQSVAVARAGLLSDEELTTLAETFSALGDSNRVKILFALSTTELCVCDLAAVVGISESAVSQHLRLLRSMRWVKGRREGRMVYYSLADQHVRDLLGIELEHTRAG